MAKTISKVLIPLKSGPSELHTFLKKYHAEFIRESSKNEVGDGTPAGHVYWSAPVGNWLLVVKKGNNAQVTFHAKDDCPCKMI
jgi:hypothetical protein